LVNTSLPSFHSSFKVNLASNVILGPMLWFIKYVYHPQPPLDPIMYFLN
jgi:hypothetical protein